jgi:hypothetical protein
MWPIGSRYFLNVDLAFRFRHLPTWLLIIGYPVFWLEMAIKPGPNTSAAASALFLLLFLSLLYSYRKRIRENLCPAHSFSFYFWGIPIAFILFISLFQAILPLHLLQEADALNYHYSLPRQHLILGSFKHLPWSGADLWLLPIQFSLSPYWFVTKLPNKFPQFLFLLGLLSIVWTWVRRLTPSSTVAPWVALSALVGSHGMSIQFGTGMLDIPITYLACACVDSLLYGHTVMASIEITFFAWSKSFMPAEIGIVILFGLLLYVLLGRRFSWGFGFSSSLLPRPTCWKSLIGWSTLASVIVAGPFLAKSMYYAGTPLFPFGTFWMGGTFARTNALREAVLATSHQMITVRDMYGCGRGLKDLIAHVWRVSVPSRGVNNSFDYPLGLPYLLLVVPFLFLMGRSLLRGRISTLAVLAVAFWGLWWMGSQQSRWLYLPLTLIIVTTLSDPIGFESRALAGGLFIGLLLTCFSLTRAYLPDFRRWPEIPLRESDRKLMSLSREWHKPNAMPVKDKEIAYAEVPVLVQQDDPMWILPTNSTQ